MSALDAGHECLFGTALADKARVKAKLNELFEFWALQTDSAAFIEGVLCGGAVAPPSPVGISASPVASASQVSFPLIPPRAQPEAHAEPLPQVPAELVPPNLALNSGSALPTIQLNDQAPTKPGQGRQVGDVAPWAQPSGPGPGSPVSPSLRPRPSRTSRKSSVASSSSLITPLTLPGEDDEAPKVDIPQFYFPLAERREAQAQAEEARIREHFSAAPADVGLGIDPFLSVCKEVCGFPSFFATPFMERAAGKGASSVTLDQFLKVWRELIRGRDMYERTFNLLSRPGLDYIEPQDFVPWLNELLEYHPALEFLKNTPEFQKSYVETVISLIFYSVSQFGNGRLTLWEVRQSNLIDVFTLVDEETEINEVKTYFSYEHFYVIYCKFWELDRNKDHHLEPEDLYRYSNYSLLPSIVDRIFEVHCPAGKMNYSQFVHFIVSEEDKNTPMALAYWIRVLDLDGNGVVSPSEMEVFYKDQLGRLACIPHEAVAFADVLCQLHDMVQPQEKNRFTLYDLKRCRMGGNFVNVLCNINKFLQFEQADPFIGHEDRMILGATDWNRFADLEYLRLAAEEDNDMDEGFGFDDDDI